MNKDISDQLSWKEFLKQSKKNIKVKTVEPFNRLIAHSKNFFLISGYGAFTLGYQIIITKDFIPSFGLVEEENFDELSFIIKIPKIYFFDFLFSFLEDFFFLSVDFLPLRLRVFFLDLPPTIGLT